MSHKMIPGSFRPEGEDCFTAGLWVEGQPRYYRINVLDLSPEDTIEGALNSAHESGIGEVEL